MCGILGAKMLRCWSGAFSLVAFVPVSRILSCPAKRRDEAVIYLPRQSPVAIKRHFQLFVAKGLDTALHSGKDLAVSLKHSQNECPCEQNARHFVLAPMLPWRCSSREPLRLSPPGVSARTSPAPHEWDGCRRYLLPFPTLCEQRVG